jgi:hypothetical protein
MVTYYRCQAKMPPRRFEEDRMSGWIDDLAEALQVDPLTADEMDRLLHIARDVAHRVERKGTPLASFLLGMHVARRTTDGSPRALALNDAIGLTEAVLPVAPEQPAAEQP